MENFVSYLPQDDAVVAGLGERHGGVDASETQQVTELLNEQLGALLRLSPRDFWKQVATDKSLGVFLDSYLHFRRRWFDRPLGSKVDVIAGDGDVSRRAFMVLLRMSSNQEPGRSASESLSAKDHTDLLIERKDLFDIPKLMDIAALYGHNNSDLTRRLVSNVFQAQPAFTEDLAAHIPPVVDRIVLTYNRCCATIEAVEQRIDRVITADGNLRIRGELLEIVDFLNDVTITLKAFVKAYPPAAKNLVSSHSPVPGQGSFLLALATIHDSLLPVLEEGFAVLNASPEKHVLHKADILGQGMGAKGAAQNSLDKLVDNIVDLSWKLLEFRYLSEFCGEEPEAAGAVYSSSYEDALWKGEYLFAAILSLAKGPVDNDEDGRGERGFSATRFICTGSLLRNVERRHKLYHQIRRARRRGTLVLGEVQEAQLFELMVEKRLSDGRQKAILLLTAFGMDVNDESVVKQSKISQVKDLFPDYGDGFIAAALEAYDDDPEIVIQRILEGPLHSDLSSLDPALIIKPDKAAQNRKDKGKGKMIEQQLENEGESVWEEKRPTKRPVDSFLPQADISGASTGNAEGNLLTKPGADFVTKGGRYVQRQQSYSTYSQLLDGRHENEKLRAAMRATVDQMAYEDEYDDSFDELNGYVAEAGDDEEPESLADHGAGRSMAQGGSVGSRTFNAGRPVLLTPRGRDGEKGRGTLLGQSKRKVAIQKSAPVVPEVDSQLKETPTYLLAGQDQGGRSGRGRKKWKEQGSIPNFYLKEGKLYSYKVAGAIGVSNVKDAEAIKQEQLETIHGLGAGGNAPMKKSTSGSERKADGMEQSSRAGQRALVEGEMQYRSLEADDAKGHCANRRGRRAAGRGTHERKEDNHHRKDQAMEKHFGGLGGL